MPDPRGPNRKKLDFFGNLISLLNMIYNSPTFIYHTIHIMSIWITGSVTRLDLCIKRGGDIDKYDQLEDRQYVDSKA